MLACVQNFLFTQQYRSMLFEPFPCKLGDDTEKDLVLVYH